MSKPARYEVARVLLDGNVYPQSTHATLGEANAAADALLNTAAGVWGLIVTDLDDPERGNVWGLEEA